MNRKKILILGATGMLGHKLFVKLSNYPDFDVYATTRTSDGPTDWFLPKLVEKIYVGVDVDIFDTIIRTIEDCKPDVAINCIGVVKQLPSANDPLIAIAINALLPHRIAALCKKVNARMVAISTDCVFNGLKGDYSEDDFSDASDLYGRTKYLGEVMSSHCITLRTSIIGHELKGKYGLIEWFLSQKGKVSGYTKAIFSGFPTVEIARIITEYIIPDARLKGLYHLSSNPISKFDLLKMIAEKYKKQIVIEPYEDFNLDRSLDLTKFCNTTGYVSPSWPKLIERMYDDFMESSYYAKR